VYHARAMKSRNNIFAGMFLLGLTGVLIGVVLESLAASLIAGFFGAQIELFLGK